MTSTVTRRRAPPSSGIQVVIGPGSAGVGQVLGGVYIGPSTLDPLAGYPPASFDPAAHDFVAAGGGVPVYAGTIDGRTRDGASLSMFCLDVGVATAEGLGYATARWGASGVPHLGAVARIVTSCYPRTGEPRAATGNAQRAAAAQLAVWFFTNNVVVGSISPLFPLVAGIVSGVLTTGPLAEPAKWAIAGATAGTFLRYVPTDAADPRPIAAQRLILAGRLDP